MKRNRFTEIGLDRLIRLAWLEKVSTLTLAGNDKKNIKAILQEDLQSTFRSNRTDVRGSLDKTITILMKIWCNSPITLESLREEGLELLKRIPKTEHTAVHWGMVAAVYPFWSSVATQVGRLLKLQGLAAALQVQRRIREQYGERETVSRRGRYVLRSYLDWGLLQETDKKGIYTTGATLAVNDLRLIVWMVEAFLRSRDGGSFPLNDILESPSFFPFRIKRIHAESLVHASSHLDIIRHGLDGELVLLK